MRQQETVKGNAITPTEYKAFQQAYDFFNKQLFDKSLPPVLITLQRHAKMSGYFAPDRFTGRNGDNTTHEQSLNPDGFTGESDEWILSVLVHEMAHEWQQEYGQLPTRGYHDRQWAAKMKEIGLQPTSTGMADGKETGQHMSHLIVKKGPYTLGYAKLKASGVQLNWPTDFFGGNLPR
jgi:hypothetical protein